MFNIKNILVPIDFSPTSMEALTHAIYMAKLNAAGITLIHVIESKQPLITSLDYPLFDSIDFEANEQITINQANQYLAKLVENIKQKEEIKIDFLVSIGWVKGNIIETAKSIRADIIVMGTHGINGFREFIIGSNTFRVVNEAECPVLSVQNHCDKPGFKNILVPFRDRPHSREKVDYAIKMAEIYGAQIHVLGIDTDDDENQFTKILKEAEQIMSVVESHDLKCNIKVISTDYLAEEVLKYAEKSKIDLIVVMSDLDRMRISEYFMGPFCQQMVNHSPIPILSIRPTFNPNTVDLQGYGW